ncbi:MAG: helix-turn-helix transcriptional regulator [Glaciecola sp.]|jgi:putative transcriptional regulator
MIRILLIQHLDEKAYRENRRITLKEVSEETKIGRATLTRIANVKRKEDKFYSVGLDVIDKLCDYFECEPGDLLLKVPDE